MEGGRINWSSLPRSYVCPLDAHALDSVILLPCVFGELPQVSAALLKFTNARGPSGVPQFRESWSFQETIVGKQTFLTSMEPDLFLIGTIFINGKFAQ